LLTQKQKKLWHIYIEITKKILLIGEKLIPWVSILVPNYYFAYATSELMNPQVKIDAHVESRIMASIKVRSESSILDKDTRMQIMAMLAFCSLST
jgi:hypothetical protein